MKVSGQLHVPTALLPGKESRVPTGQDAGRVPVPVWTRWWREEFAASAGNRTIDHPIVQPVASRYTDWTIPGHIIIIIIIITSPPKYRSVSAERGFIQTFPDWFDNEIYVYLWYYSLRRNTNGNGGKTH
jgi:hypothetical protein